MTLADRRTLYDQTICMLYTRSCTANKHRLITWLCLGVGFYCGILAFPKKIFLKRQVSSSCALSSELLLYFVFHFYFLFIVLIKLALTKPLYISKPCCKESTLNKCLAHRSSTEPHREKTGLLPMRKQRRRSASQHDVYFHLSASYDSLTSKRSTTRTEQLTECREPLQKLRLRLCSMYI